MITKQQRTTILALVENCCVYEGQVALWDHLRPRQVDPACADLVTANFNRAFKNADEAGQALLKYLDSLMEVDNAGNK